MADALPSDLLPRKTLAALLENARLAEAAYSDGVVPDGFEDVDLAALGLKARNIDGAFFVNGNAAARLTQRDGDLYLAFRGTDSLDDLRDLSELGDAYVHEFDRLLEAIAGSDFGGRLHVTGHSLGAVAVHQLSLGRAGFGEAFEEAHYASFAAPVFDDPLAVASFGYANDAIYGALADEPPPFVRDVYWRTTENGVETLRPTDAGNLEPHGIANIAEGLARLMAADALRPAFGLVERRGLDLDATVILDGGDGAFAIPGAFEGDVVLLGRDLRDAGSAEGRSDQLVGRNAARASDWIDGMRGDDGLSGRRGDDRLIGGEGFDTLSGGAGDDALFGGENRDRLSGGAGDDRFVMRERQAHADLILDFEGGASTGGERDVIVLSARVFGGAAGAEVAVAALGAEPLGDAPTAFYDERNGRLFYDPDGDGEARAELVAILVNRPAALVAGDVVLA